MGINKRVFELVREARGEILMKAVIVILVNLTYLLQAFAMALTVKEIYVGGTMAHAVRYAIIALAALLIRCLMTHYLDGFSRKIGVRVKTKIRDRLFEKIISLGPGYVMDQRSGKLQSVLMDGVENLEPYLIGFLPQIIAATCIGIAGGIAACFIEPIAGVITLLTVVICMITPYIMLPFVRTSYIGYWKEYAFLNAQYIDAIQGISTLKAFNASLDKGKELEENAAHFYRTQLHNTFFSVMDSGIMLLLTSVIEFVVIGVAACRKTTLVNAELMLPMILFMAAVCARPLMDLNRAWHASMMGMSASETILELLDEKHELQISTDPLSVGLEGETADIELEHVTFKYPKGNVPALNDVSMHIKRGQTVAVVGSSGSGKSTLANLLYRFYDIQKGAIKINGTDIRNFDPEYLRDHLSVVFQENYLIEGTIAENIRLANPGADMETVVQAAKNAGADEFIREFPDGYETKVGERGAMLSGGQKQRIAIARALLKSAPIRIFDEATSIVDTISEQKIQEAIESLTGTATTIIIAHRLSTVKNADVIFVIDDGKVVEQGTHGELLARKGRYHALVSAQLGNVNTWKEGAV